MLGGPFEAHPWGEGTSGPPQHHFPQGLSVVTLIGDTTGTMYGNVEPSQGQKWVPGPGKGEGREHPWVLGVLGGGGEPSSPIVLNGHPNVPFGVLLCSHEQGWWQERGVPISIPGTQWLSLGYPKRDPQEGSPEGWWHQRGPPHSHP